MIFARRAGSFLSAPRPAAGGSSQARRFLTLGCAFAGATLAGGIAFTEAGGCARCGGAAAISIAPVLAPPVAPILREERKRASRGSLKRVEAIAGGNYTVCVRECDGSFFPVSYFGAKSRADSLEQICQAQCPNTKVALYSFPFGGTIDDAVSSSGELYDLLPNAHKFEQSYDSACSCRAPGQSWAQALARAEARYGRGAHDIVVSADEAARMSRPAIDPSRSAAATDTRGDPNATVVLDRNGVDTKLGAATAKMSRAASGIRDDDQDRPARLGLRQGQTVQEAGPDGRTRTVRVLPTTF